MKELSIEQKAKRYDEAIEKFDVILNLDIVKESGTIFADDVRKILPELEESEDEKVRKALIKLVKKTGEGYENVIDGVSIENAISWLEKQGEQNPAWSEEDDYNLRCCIAKVQSDIDNGRIGRNRELLTWLKSLKDRTLGSRVSQI